jgi:hypothetical protein
MTKRAARSKLLICNTIEQSNHLERIRDCPRARKAVVQIYRFREPLQTNSIAAQATDLTLKEES